MQGRYKVPEVRKQVCLVSTRDISSLPVVDEYRLKLPARKYRVHQAAVELLNGAVLERLSANPEASD